MNNHSVSGRTPGADPLLAPSASRSSADDSMPDSPGPPDSATRPSRSRPPRRQHPARGARALALAASVVATGSIAATLAYSEGAWSADNEVIAEGPTTQLASSVAAVDNSSAAAPTAADGTPPTTLSSTTVASTTPETTQPADNEVTAIPDPSGFADGVFLGTAEYTDWGDVQVQVTVSEGGIVDIAAVQYPTGRKSSNINSQAIPMLEANAVAVQSADLDIVSGATYTSRTYADSMQAALDQASLATAREAVTS